MIRLGNIDFSNCYPLHGPLLEGDRPDWLQVVDGTPSELNRRLSSGELDVAPASSIELARHSREYSALGGLCIGSDGPVDSILLVSRLPLAELDGRTVALPTASATSRCLVRVLLELRLGSFPRWTDFDQASGNPLAATPADSPVAAGAQETPDAALFIGDAALRLPIRAGEVRYDLGAEWKKWTGLPFVFALWMVRDDAVHRTEIGQLHERLLEARDVLPAAYPELATAASSRFGIPARRLRRYWSHIRYELNERMLSGFHRFLEYAMELGEAPRAHEVRLI